LVGEEYKGEMHGLLSATTHEYHGLRKIQIEMTAGRIPFGSSSTLPNEIIQAVAAVGPTGQETTFKRGARSAYTYSR